MKKIILKIIVILITISIIMSYTSKSVKKAAEISEEPSKVYQNTVNSENIIKPQTGFDLSIRSFVTNINGRELINEQEQYTREPNIKLENLNSGETTTAEYKAQKSPVRVAVGDIVIYTIRIYNEGGISGYANSITDYLPPQLEFVMNDVENFNAKYGWKIDPTLRKATTNILEMPTIDPEDTLIKAFDGQTLDYKEIKIKCKVVSKNYIEKIITNIVEITDFKDIQGNEITDRDSSKQNVMQLSGITDETLPDYKGNKSNKSVLIDTNYFYKGIEDDDDFEKLILEEFDLSLKQYITKINEIEITDRTPTFKQKYIYEQNKTPVEVYENDLVEYTIRIYNEGDIDGYAKEIKNDIPEGLKFLPENLTNQAYNWVMIDENGNETEDEANAVGIKTNYLSKDEEIKMERKNIIEKFKNTKEAPDYKEIKLVLQVTNKNGIITNQSQISVSTDENGRAVEDRDSIANQWNEGEDDQDTEQVDNKFIELGLIKMINQVTSKVQEQEEQNEIIGNVEETVQKLEPEKTKSNIREFIFSIGALPIM